MAASDPFGIEQIQARRPGVLDRVLGVDPGIEGGLGMLGVPGWRVLAVRKLPTLVVAEKRMVDAVALAQIIRELAPSLVLLEKVQPMRESRDTDPRPADGVTTAGKPPERQHHMGTVGAFHYGWTCGQIYDSILFAGHKPMMVHPSTWKAAAGLRGRGGDYATRKRQALALARQTWPDVGIASDGCAEALLLARFGWASQLRFF